jgi:DNA-binding transcriptional MerR regulator
MTAATLTIREIGTQCDVTPRTLRFCDARELLFPIREGRRRLFTRRDRARLELILRGKRFGFSLREIRPLRDLCDMGDSQETQLARTCALARVHQAETEAQRAALDEAIAELKAQMARGAAELERRRPGSAAAAASRPAPDPAAPERPAPQPAAPDPH